MGVENITTWLDRLKMTAVHCLGCGTNLTTGTYRRLLCSDATKLVAPSWREIIGIVLERNSQLFNEEDLFDDGSRDLFAESVFEHLRVFRVLNINFRY